VYLMPTSHNPTGTVMPSEQRRQVALMAAESGTAIAEDNTLADLVVDRPTPPPLAAHVGGDVPVIGICSMPKLFWAGPRARWVRLPHGNAGEFAQLALRCGVIVTPGTAMSVDASHTNYLRRPFFHHPGTLCEGVTRLARAWEAYAPFAGAGNPTVSMIV